jgi:hypothetical protein
LSTLTTTRARTEVVAVITVADPSLACTMEVPTVVQTVAPALTIRARARTTIAQRAMALSALEIAAPDPTAVNPTPSPMVPMSPTEVTPTVSPHLAASPLARIWKVALTVSPHLAASLLALPWLLAAPASRLLVFLLFWLPSPLPFSRH